MICISLKFLTAVTIPHGGLETGWVRAYFSGSAKGKPPSHTVGLEHW